MIYEFHEEFQFYTYIIIMRIYNNITCHQAIMLYILLSNFIKFVTLTASWEVCTEIICMIYKKIQKNERKINILF